MSARWMIAAAAVLVATPATAQSSPEDLADRFERALVAGDYRVLPLAEGFTYTENGARLDPWDGMWRTTTALEGAVDFPELDYRVELADGDTVVRIVESIENTVHGVMAYRLVADGDQIASVDVLPIREEFGGDRGGTITLLQPMLPFTMDGELVGPPDPAFAQAHSNPVQDIEQTIRRYFAFATGEAEGPLPMDFGFPDDCVRTDNGQRATDVSDADLLDPAQPGFRPFALGCNAQMQSGYYSNFSVGDVRIFADSARGIGIAFVRLDQAGTVLSFEAPGIGTVTYPGPRGAVEGANTGEQFDGRILTNMISPMSVNGAYLFKLDERGGIARIDAFYRGAPLGWDAVPD
ncbi:hypothetical protein OZN62_04580 [Aurantiacibacter sp. MUD11]|uniref:hypothetical protein n=1 Tax=Aurantiacibacter sp. MUD11 TaxID=3003265 RepID=UPI0022AA3852|nr:hypothetical protein [Aurantiacibacter sp. MUD11]WAT18850.1 hypothetical protein OZN62_04580 [Aurantiacibacter sp. MUD11]